ncbi:hypothetical protein RIR_jg4727.t2 [Rhizophagus irregularis DAOM 181602=DAOM 197198]|nr:hypothetical protein RIR_jg4727.t2 [Rhizophagus irregularis DAOM 181602=DAOM 197198]
MVATRKFTTTSALIAAHPSTAARPSTTAATSNKKRCRRSATSNRKSKNRLKALKAARKPKVQLLEGGYCTQGLLNDLKRGCLQTVYSYSQGMVLDGSLPVDGVFIFPVSSS